MAWRIGVDIGGTFTDVAVVDDASRLIGADAGVVTPLADVEIDGLVAVLKAACVEAIAVALLFSDLKLVSRTRMRTRCHRRWSADSALVHRRDHRPATNIRVRVAAAGGWRCRPEVRRS